MPTTPIFIPSGVLADPLDADDVIRVDRSGKTMYTRVEEFASDPAFTAQYAPIASPTFTGNVVVPNADAATEAMNRRSADTRYAPQAALRFDGTASNFASTPDAADLDGLSEIELVFRGALTDWTSGGDQTLIAKRATSQWSYQLNISGTGDIVYSMTNDGTTTTGNVIIRTPTVAFVDGVTYWIKATWRASDQRVQIFVAPDAATEAEAVWVQASVDASTTATAMHAGTSALEVGINRASLNPMIGTVKRAIVRSAIGGTKIADFNAETPFASRLTDSVGKVWSLTGSNWSWVTSPF